LEEYRVESRIELQEVLFADSWNEELGSSRGRTRASTSGSRSIRTARAGSSCRWS